MLLLLLPLLLLHRCCRLLRLLLWPACSASVCRCLVTCCAHMLKWGSRMRSCSRQQHRYAHLPDDETVVNCMLQCPCVGDGACAGLGGQLQCMHTSSVTLLRCDYCLQVLSMRISSLEVDTDAQAKIIWMMKQLGWRDEGLEKILGGLIPNLSELL